MNKIIIGLAGEIASGKGTVAKYIKEEYRGKSHRFSNMLRDVLDRLYIEETRENMANLSTMLRKTFGEDIIAKVMFHDVKNDGSQIVAIDGVRRLADIKYLKELPEFKLVYVEASVENRYKRMHVRGENPDDNKKTFEEFIKDHELESELQIKDLKNYANYVIENNGDFNDLHGQIDKIIKECESK